MMDVQPFGKTVARRVSSINSHCHATQRVLHETKTIKTQTFGSSLTSLSYKWLWMRHRSLVKLNRNDRGSNLKVLPPIFGNLIFYAAIQSMTLELTFKIKVLTNVSERCFSSHVWVGWSEHVQKHTGPSTEVKSVCLRLPFPPCL